ncbi:MAG TPA: SOS response-associated peptidase [Noviherbaspirillum sp.]|uniref:SOS response-associated peptidase n=1 Tax=Noviherbaspirillum sp. TaxID=1926288 RepID=UPI002D30D024|nr:SOS response-associated peptidase [Noviherbaspirillum sp.]HYD95981.1 SOS response-associated peptidase [Noviherbaspirillum sp.]
MCGRFASNTPPWQLQQWYDALSYPDTAPRYNIAPGTMIAVVRDSPDGRAGSLMRWGFIPAWARDPSSMPMLNNARGETVAEKPMFRQAFRRRRCLIPASGFYEWKAVPGQRTKQPFFISFSDGTPMSFAGIWETSRKADGTSIDTCTILTTEANAVLAPIHHRMPVLVDRADWATWLAAEPVPDAELLQLVKPFDPARLQAWGVAHAVNKVVNDDPSLLQPIA